MNNYKRINELKEELIRLEKEQADYEEPLFIRDAPIGTRYLKSDDDTDEYILAQTGCGEYNLISLRNGNRFTEPVKEKAISSIGGTPILGSQTICKLTKGKFRVKK